MVGKPFPRAAVFMAAAASALLLGGCADFLGNSVFPSYLPSLDGSAEFGDLVPGGAYKGEYDIWLRTVTAMSGRRFVVVGLDYYDDVNRADLFLIFTGDLKFIRKISRENIYGAGFEYGASRFAAPAPAGDNILLGFYGPTNPLVSVNPFDGTWSAYSDPLNLVGQYSYMNNPGIAMPATGSVWFVRGDEENLLYYEELTSAYLSGSTGSKTVFAAPSTETGGSFWGAAPNADRTAVTAAFRGYTSGKIFAAAAPGTPAAFPNPLFATDVTPFSAVPYYGYETMFAVRGGLVAANWGDDWKFYRFGGGVETGPGDEDREDLVWTFAPEGDTYYLVEGPNSRIFKIRTWW